MLECEHGFVRNMKPYKNSRSKIWRDMKKPTDVPSVDFVILITLLTFLSLSKFLLFFIYSIVWGSTFSLPHQDLLHLL